MLFIEIKPWKCWYWQQIQNSLFALTEKSLHIPVVFDSTILKSNKFELSCMQLCATMHACTHAQLQTQTHTQTHTQTDRHRHTQTDRDTETHTHACT